MSSSNLCTSLRGCSSAGGGTVEQGVRVLVRPGSTLSCSEGYCKLSIIKIRVEGTYNTRNDFLKPLCCTFGLDLSLFKQSSNSNSGYRTGFEKLTIPELINVIFTKLNNGSW